MTKKVSLGIPATSIPLAVVVGIIAGFAVGKSFITFLFLFQGHYAHHQPPHSKGYAIYRTGSTTTLHWFLVGSTSFLCLIGAGLLSKGVGFFQYYHFSKGVGGDVAETGDGPGSFQVAGNVWHLEYGNPEVSRFFLSQKDQRSFATFKRGISANVFIQTGSATTNGGWQIFNAIFGWSKFSLLPFS